MCGISVYSAAEDPEVDDLEPSFGDRFVVDERGRIYYVTPRSVVGVW